MSPNTSDLTEHADASRDRFVALSYVLEAFAEATLDGIEEDCFAQAALFTAFQSLVTSYGEEAAAAFAERLPARVRDGEFSIATRQ